MTLQIPWGSVEIALSCTVSEINAFLHFMQKFKMDAKNGGKRIIGKILPDDSANILGVKNFAEISLSHSVFEINVFLYFTKKLKIAANMASKRLLGKTTE